MNGDRRHIAIVVKKRLALSLLLGCSLFAAGCSSLAMLFGNGDENKQQVIDDPGPATPYEVKLSGVDAKKQKRLLAVLHETSTAIRLRDRPPSTLAGLKPSRSSRPNSGRSTVSAARGIRWPRPGSAG
ncbi:MAG: hypothetical protein ACD_75C02065G0002 [uncultured bacterium]|nr:MAG: hypothetical protein ACD_75C02065G0002 [uncultured bacterium]